MKCLLRKIDKKAVILFVIILSLNLLISFLLNSFQLPNWDIFSIKLISSFCLATLIPLMINIIKEPIDPEYAIFILFFSLIASSMVLSFTVDYVKSLKTTALMIDKEAIWLDILLTGIFFICMLIVMIKTVYTMIHKDKRN